MKLLLFSVIFIVFVTYSCSSDYRYDRYSGNATNPEIYRRGRTKDTNCTIVVKHCTPHEGSRIDGTCNNYNHPTRGSARGPYLRLLNPDYSNNKRDIRKDRNGNELPSARRVRTTLQTDGRVVDRHDFNVAAYHYLEFIHLDVSVLNGPFDYLVKRQYCCQPEGQLDPRCKPIPVPNDDPYLRVTDIRCLNFSRADTFQDDGCLKETFPPEQINFQTPVIDLSTIYGVDERSQNTVRLYKHGLLKLEYRDFRHVPLVNLTNNTNNLPSSLSVIDPVVLANLTALSQQILNLTMSNSSMSGNMTIQNTTIFTDSPMWQNGTMQNNSQTLNSENMVGVLSMLQNLQMINPQMLDNLTMLNPTMMGNLTMLNQQMIGNLSQLNPQALANLIQLNPQLLGILSNLANVTSTNRQNRQVNVPVSLPTTGGLNDAILSPIMEEVDDVTPTLLSFINMTNLNTSICLQNMGNETRCYVFGFPEAGNFDLRTTSFAIFFMREHNRLAKALHRLNPCWKDDRLFKVARQINIATASNILMYELLPMILGYKNMLKYGLISSHVQHVTAYDEDAVPLVYAEFEVAVRYYHTMLDGRIKLYDEKYHYDKEFSASNTTYRQSLLEQSKNFEKINRGTFYQQAANIDDIQDPEISEKYYGDLQRAADLPTLDIQRGRDLGVRGYNDYRHICGLKPAKRFEDFSDVMDHEKLEALRRLYVHIEDIDLLAGIISENFIPGTFAGPTLFCIMTKQLQLFRFADRFWFERGDQFHSLTLAQLHEVRKTNIARFACDNADAIKFIQPRAFENVGPHNQHVPCTHIPGLDITQWKDNSCYNDKYLHGHYAHDVDSHEEFESNRPLNRDGQVKNNRNEIYKSKNKDGYKMHWSADNLGNQEYETRWPMPRESNVKYGLAWNLNDHVSKYSRPTKNEHLIHWSMNLDSENNDKNQNGTHTGDNDNKHNGEMILHVNNSHTRWSIHKYDKHEGAVYGPLKNHHQKDFLALKHFDDEKYKKEKFQHKTEDDGKYKAEIYQPKIEDDGKYDDDTDWPVKKDGKHNELKTRHKHYDVSHSLTPPIFPSTSHQSYQPDSSQFTPFSQSFLPVT